MIARARSIDILEFVWRSLVLGIGLILVIPAPWVLVWYLKWIVPCVQVHPTNIAMQRLSQKSLKQNGRRKDDRLLSNFGAGKLHAPRK
jgi:hypothetical protein